MTEKKIAFTCGWGQSSQKLYDKYKLIAPNRSGRWNYLVGVPNIDDADIVFMFDGMKEHNNSELTEKLKTKKLFAVRTEPPDVSQNPVRIPTELSEKVTLIDYTTQPIWYFSKWWEMSRAISHEDFLSMQYEKREKKISCIVSSKRLIPGHRKRLDFIKRLIKEEPDLLTLYGAGSRELDSDGQWEQVGNNGIRCLKNRGSLPNKKKYLAYKGFEYTLCCENSYIPNYFSDSLFDAMLMWSMPIYWGAPNVADYLPSDSFYSLTENLGEEDIETVKNACARPPSQKNIKAIGEARHLILEKYSLWPSLQYVLENY